MKPQTRKKILFVDDDEGVREVVEGLLDISGYDRIPAVNGKEALEILKSQPIDLVLSDVMMPVCDGIEMLRQIRLQYGQSLPVILMSGYSDIPMWRMLEIGADAFIGKPFDMKQLTSAIEDHLKPSIQRWATPPATAPKLDLTMTFASLEALNAPTGIHFGRGGIFVGLVRPDLSRGKALTLNIQLPPSAGGICIKGTGIVRWARGTAVADLPPGIGIEFTHLDAASIKYVEGLSEMRQTLAHIPQGPLGKAALESQPKIKKTG